MLQEIRFIWRIIGLFVVMLFIISGGITLYSIEQGITLIDPITTYKKLIYVNFGLVIIYWFFACINLFVDIPHATKPEVKGDENEL